MNKQRSVRWSLKNWSNKWWQSLFWSISTLSEKLFWKLTSWTMSTTKYCLSMMMKTFYIQWSSIARTWFLQNVTMRSITRNCWSSFTLIQIFINHLNLKYFMIIKELIRWQAKWAEKLSEYNFKIIYQLKKQNLKVDVLIRMSDFKSVEANDDHKLYQHQMLLSKDRFELQLIKDDQKTDQDLTQILLKSDSESDSESDSDSKLESKANQNLIKEMISIQNQIIVENQTNQLCFNIQIVMKQNKKTCQDIDLDNCKILDEVLWKDDKLWVSQLMIILLIRKAHDLLINDHSDMNWTLNLLRWSYCWSKMRTMIKYYIWNCYVCRRSKASRDWINKLLKSLLILEQQWQNILLNFIINLSESDESNAILTVINRLFKKRHYILCWSDDKEIFAE